MQAKSDGISGQSHCNQSHLIRKIRIYFQNLQQSCGGLSAEVCRSNYGKKVLDDSHIGVVGVGIGVVAGGILFGPELLAACGVNLAACTELGITAAELPFGAATAGGAALGMGGFGSIAAKEVAAFADAAAHGAGAAKGVSTNPSEAFFWSGRTHGVGGADIAQQIATQQGGTTLEALMAQRGIQMPKWDATNPVVVKAWQEISAQYANGVSGTVRAVIGQSLRPGNVWETAELPALMKNPNVDKIITIDPVTMAQKVIYIRGEL